MVIRAHGEIETALRVAIVEALIEPHELELERLSFPLKLDLAIALGVVRNSVRPLFLRLNKTRNEFAHDPRAEFTEKDARDLVNVLSEGYRDGLKTDLDNAKTPKEILRIVFVVAFLEALGAAERVQEHNKRLQELLRRAHVLFEGHDGLRVPESTGEAAPNSGVQPTPASGRG